MCLSQETHWSKRLKSPYGKVCQEIIKHNNNFPTQINNFKSSFKNNLTHNKYWTSYVFLTPWKNWPRKAFESCCSSLKAQYSPSFHGKSFPRQEKRPFVSLSPNPWFKPTFTNPKWEIETNTSLVSPASSSAGTGNHSAATQLIPRPCFSQVLFDI